MLHPDLPGILNVKAQSEASLIRRWLIFDCFLLRYKNLELIRHHLVDSAKLYHLDYYNYIALWIHKPGSAVQIDNLDFSELVFILGNLSDVGWSPNFML